MQGAGKEAEGIPRPQVCDVYNAGKAARGYSRTSASDVPGCRGGCLWAFHGSVLDVCVDDDLGRRRPCRERESVTVEREREISEEAQDGKSIGNRQMEDNF